MAAEWYFQLMGVETGPLTGTQIRERITAGDIGPDTLIRKGADATWLRAERIPGLFPEAPILPPAPALATGQVGPDIDDDVADSQAGRATAAGVSQPRLTLGRLEPVQAELRYPALGIVAFIYNVSGALVLLVGLVAAAAMVVNQGVEGLMLGAWVLMVGIGLLAVAQGIALARDLEANARAARLLLEKLRQEQHDRGS